MPITGTMGAADTWNDGNLGNCFYQIFDTGMLGANITTFEFNWTSNGTHPEVYYDIVVKLCWQYQSPQWITYYEDYGLGVDGVVQNVVFDTSGFYQDDYLIGIQVELYVGSYKLGTEAIYADDFSITYTAGGTEEAPVIESTLIDDLVNWFVPIALMLIPAYILGIYCKIGVWGLLIGATVGVSMGYVFLGADVVPLWLVFSVIVCDVGLAYRSMR